MGIGEIIALGALIISALSLMRVFGKDGKNNASELTTVIVKLEAIGNDIAEIKKDMRGVKADIREHESRITKTEQKIETLEKIIKMYHQHDGAEE